MPRIQIGASPRAAAKSSRLPQSPTQSAKATRALPAMVTATGWARTQARRSEKVLVIVGCGFAGPGPSAEIGSEGEGKLDPAGSLTLTVPAKGTLITIGMLGRGLNQAASRNFCTTIGANLRLDAVRGLAGGRLEARGDALCDSRLARLQDGRADARAQAGAVPAGQFPD